jgi:hypothetical protein
MSEMFGRSASLTQTDEVRLQSIEIFNVKEKCGTGGRERIFRGSPGEHNHE